MSVRNDIDIVDSDSGKVGLPLVLEMFLYQFRSIWSENN